VKKGKMMKGALMKKQSMDPDPGNDDGGGAVKSRQRSAKEDVIAQLLCRWWYSEPYLGKDWPPQEESFYAERLEKGSMRRVTMQEWEWLPEVDDAGRRKVYELSQFRGVFRNSAGDIVDLRPKETCPCLNNFLQKDLGTLCQMLLSAYRNQLKDLDNCRYNNEKMRNELKANLVKITHLASIQNPLR